MVLAAVIVGIIFLVIVIGIETALLVVLRIGITQVAAILEAMW